MRGQTVQSACRFFHFLMNSTVTTVWCHLLGRLYPSPQTFLSYSMNNLMIQKPKFVCFGVFLMCLKLLSPEVRTCTQNLSPCMSINTLLLFSKIVFSLLTSHEYYRFLSEISPEISCPHKIQQILHKNFPIIVLIRCLLPS